MSPDVPPELAETFKSLDEALEEFRQIKERLKAGPHHEAAQGTVAATALSVESEATA